MNRSFVSPADALSLVRSGHRVFIHGMAAAPQVLISALASRTDVRDVQIVQMHTEGPAPYADAGEQDRFRVNALFIGSNLRGAVQQGRADYTPIFFSDVPALIRSGSMPIDVALVHVSPPDEHGYCSLGVSVEATKAAIDSAGIIIAQVNPRMPRTHGDGLVHVSRIAAMVGVDEPIPVIACPAPAEQERKIGQYVASLIPDRATIQVGIGGIPNAVLAALGGHRDLGVHSEMFSDGVVDLVEQGVITGRFKEVHPGKLVAGFVIGTQRLYDFVDDNPAVAMLDIAYVNDTAVIRRNPKVVAINSAIEIDLTGQVCADSIGHLPYSGVGGQVDFVRGAALSAGGAPIIAMASTTRDGKSKIVSQLKPGAGVVTTRAHVHWVVTEFGCANLHGKSIRERAKSLIELSHPDHREQLERDAYALLL